MNDSDTNTLTLIGLAYRAGKVSWGDTAAYASVKEGSARLLFLASDAGHGVADRFGGLAAKSGLPCVTLEAGKARLGGAIGRELCSVLTVNDKGFAESLMKKQNDPK